MDERGNQRSVDGPHFAGAEALQESKWLGIFSHASAIGFAILDNRLRYQTINHSLAAINGVPAEAHLGRTVREVFGEIAGKVELSYQRVLASGQALHFEITETVLPTRTEPGYWIDSCFPIRDRAGGVKQLGLLVVEVTQQRKLEKFFLELAGELRHTKSQENFWFARELQESINQYHAALAKSLSCLIRDDWEPEQSAELLPQSVELLDQRILAMRTLVSAVASRIPIDQQL